MPDDLAALITRAENASAAAKELRYREIEAVVPELVAALKAARPQLDRAKAEHDEFCQIRDDLAGEEAEVATHDDLPDVKPVDILVRAEEFSAHWKKMYNGATLATAFLDELAAELKAARAQLEQVREIGQRYAQSKTWDDRDALAEQAEGREILEAIDG